MNAAVKRAQLTLDELHQLRWLLGGALTLLGVFTVMFMDIEAWWLMTLTATASVVATLRPTLPARIPRSVHLLAFPFIAAFFTIDLWLRSELLPAMVRLDMLLLLYRAIVYRQRRDDLQVIILGLFLVVVAGVLTVSLAFALQILLYTACALVFLLVLTLVEGRDSARGGTAPAPAPPVGGPPAWATHANWPRLLRRVVSVSDWRIVALAGGLFVGVIAASALLFLLIPRFQLDTGMFLDRFISKKARTGFTDTIKFGDVTEIQQDTSVALHIDVSDTGQIPLEPYWRMLVLDDYHNGTFRMSPALQAALFDRRPTTGVIAWGSDTVRRGRGTWTFYLEPGVSRYLPLLGRFRTLNFAEAQTFKRASSAGLIALTKDPVTMTAYRVHSFDLATPLQDEPAEYYGDSRLSDDPAEDQREHLLLRNLARQAAGDSPASTAEFAARVCAWLRRRHSYSLSPRIPEGPGDPLVNWVNSEAPGHCELFAGSFVLLARAAGYPARLVTGFRGGTWNAFAGQSFTVRNSDAHAWAEIFDRDARSWLRADPLEQGATTGTTGESGGDTAMRRIDRSWAARIDSLRVFWYRRVVNFDQASQVETLKVAKQLAQSALDRLRVKIGYGAVALKTWWHEPWDARRSGRLALSLAAAVGLTLLWRWLRVLIMRGAPWRRGARRDDPIRREAGRWLQRLRVRPVSEFDRQVIDDLQRLRFGRRETWPEPVTVFRYARRTARNFRRSQPRAR